MGKTGFYGAISLDGYLAGAKDQLDWLLETDTGTSTTYEKFFETIDATAMGRKTYEEAKKNVGDGEALSRKRKLCVFPSDADRFNGRSSCGSRPGCFLSQLKKKRKRFGWLAVEKLLHPFIGSRSD